MWITKKVIDLIKLVYFLDYNTCILGFGSLQVIPFCTNLVLSNQVQLDNVVVVSYSFRKYEYTDFRPLILGKKRFKNFKYQHIHFLNSQIYKKLISILRVTLKKNWMSTEKRNRFRLDMPTLILRPASVNAWLTEFGKNTR